MRYASQAEREKQWEIESDAHTIEAYGELCTKETRFKAASDYLTEKYAAAQAALATAAANKAMNDAIRGVKV